MIRCATIIIALFVTSGVTSLTLGDINFSDVSSEVGILPYTQPFGMTGGVAAADFDCDGDIDMFVPTLMGLPDQLYRNLGDGTFEEIAVMAGVSTHLQSRIGLWFDYDGDGDLDLLVARDGLGVDTPDPSSTLALFQQNAPGEFQLVTDEALLSGDLLTENEGHVGGLAAADINNDGWLDFALSIWRGGQLLFLNNTDGTFTNITDSSGVGESNFYCWQPVFHDFNGDGWIDLFQAVDFEDNHLWLNQHDNTFVDVAAEVGVNSSFNEMGVALGDYDNDGDMDIYITNFANEVRGEWRHSVFFQNNSVGGRLAFAEVSEAYGMDDTGWGWGCTFEDFDRDTLVDLAVVNGFDRHGNLHDPSRFFINLGGTPDWFADVSDAVGFADTDISTALIAADFDRDGDLDLAQTCGLGGPFRVLYNTLTGDDAASHYLVVQPRMDGPNHFAIGAIVRATVGSTSMMRQITAGQSTQGQQPAESYFGLGKATIVDTLTIQWPDGQSTMLENVAADQVLIVTPDMDVDPCPADLDDNGTVGASDLLALLSAWGPNPDHPADLDGDGSVGASDLLILLANWGPCP